MCIMNNFNKFNSCQMIWSQSLIRCCSKGTWIREREILISNVTWSNTSFVQSFKHFQSLSFSLELDTPSDSRDLMILADTKPGIILGGLYSTIALSLTISLLSDVPGVPSIRSSWADFLVLFLGNKLASSYSATVSASETSRTDFRLADSSAVLNILASAYLLFWDLNHCLLLLFLWELCWDSWFFDSSSNFF